MYIYVHVITNKHLWINSPLSTMQMSEVNNLLIFEINFSSFGGELRLLFTSSELIFHLSALTQFSLFGGLKGTLPHLCVHNDYFIYFIMCRSVLLVSQQRRSGAVSQGGRRPFGRMAPSLLNRRFCQSLSVAHFELWSGGFAKA